MTQQAHTPQQIADFILDEVLNPFIESVLYDDYQEDWEKRQVDNENEAELFNARYDEAVRLIAAAPKLLEALKACYRAITLDSDMEEDFAPEIKQARAAIAEAEGIKKRLNWRHLP